MDILDKQNLFFQMDLDFIKIMMVNTVYRNGHIVYMTIKII